MANTPGLIGKSELISKSSAYPEGFIERITTEDWIWGQLNINNGYKMTTCWLTKAEGEVDYPAIKFATKDDKLSLQVNGMLYQNGGNYQVLDNGSNQDIAGIKRFTGTLKADNVIEGTSYEAKWGDLAERYQSDKDYPQGTLIKFGGEKEITIATDVANGVISAKPAFTINTEMNGLPVALVGRVPVRVIGKLKKFDNIMLSEIAGVAKKGSANIIGKALENKDTEEEGLVLCVTKLVL